MSKKIIIVGASTGMGKSMALQYISAGHRVGITCRREDLLKEIKEAYTDKIEYECFDVTQNENIPHLKALIEKLGGLDILIISAGWGKPS